MNFKVILFVFFGALLSSCFFKSSIFRNVKYEIATIGIDSLGVRKKLTSTKYICYFDYLFEFETDIKYKGDITLKTGEKSIEFSEDTVAVYVIRRESLVFFEFDKFRKSAKLISNDSISNKKYGKKYLPETAKNAKELYKFCENLSINDTVINYVNCNYIDFSHITNDSVIKRVFIVNDKNLITAYRILGPEFSKKGYVVYGYSYYHKRMKQGYYEEFAEKRELTNSEIEICKSMIDLVEK
jgi:hypothetical protein